MWLREAPGKRRPLQYVPGTWRYLLPIMLKYDGVKKTSSLCRKKCVPSGINLRLWGFYVLLQPCNQHWNIFWLVRYRILEHTAPRFYKTKLENLFSIGQKLIFIVKLELADLTWHSAHFFSSHIASNSSDIYNLIHFSFFHWVKTKLAPQWILHQLSTGLVFHRIWRKRAVQVKGNCFFQTRPIAIFFHLVFPFGLSHSDHLDFIWNRFNNSFFSKRLVLLHPLHIVCCSHL